MEYQEGDLVTIRLLKLNSRLNKYVVMALVRKVYQPRSGGAVLGVEFAQPTPRTEIPGDTETKSPCC